MLSSNDFRAGIAIEYRGSLWEIVETQHVKPGKGAAFVQARLKNLLTGAALRVNFRAGERVARAIITTVLMTYSYRDGDNCILVNPANGESVEVAWHHFGTVAALVKEGLEGITVVLHGENLLRVDLPTTVDLTVGITPLDERGDSTSAMTKPAVLETGATVMVPFHVRPGDKIRIDTRSRQYIGRVSDAR
jgi:elongation factor P